MMVDTKRIYKIEDKDFYGIHQGNRPIIDTNGNITARVQNPVATIRYEGRLLTVEPYQVEFVEGREVETKECCHLNEGHSDGVDTEIDIHSGYKENLITKDDIIADTIKRYASGVIGNKVGCERNYLGKGFKEIRIVWRDR